LTLAALVALGVLGHLEMARSLADQSGERMFEAELHRLDGELLRGSHPDMVEDAF
jgi:predicted ATPase